jgi:hypothetical protein
MIHGFSEAVSPIVGSIFISHMFYFGPQIHHLEFGRSVGMWLATSLSLQYTRTHAPVLLSWYRFAQQATANKILTSIAHRQPKTISLHSLEMPSPTYVHTFDGPSKGYICRQRIKDVPERHFKAIF